MTHISRELLTSLNPLSIPKSIEIPKNLPNLIHTDSRNIQKGQWFMPIKGEKFDGHTFIRSCLEKGVAGFFYEPHYEAHLSDEEKNLGIKVKDSLSFFQDLALMWRNMLPVSVIGITGSNGKTTAKEITGHLLSRIGKTLITQGSYNNEIGVPLTLAKLTSEHDFAVIEMGARHKGDIELLCRCSNPNVCVVLNIGTAHLGEFGNLETLRQTKQEMFTTTQRNAIAICPEFDEDSYQVATKFHDKVLTFGTNRGDICVRPLPCNKAGLMNFEITTPEECFTETIPTFHRAYPVNFAAAIAICHALGITPSRTGPAFAEFTGLAGRFKLYQNKSLMVVDDSYNANPESMKAGLESIVEGFPNRKLVLVLGDMLELGSSSRHQHELLGAYCAEIIKPSYLVAVGIESESMMLSAIEKGVAKERAKHFKNVDALLDNLDNILNQGDLLYIKASNSIGLNRVVQEAIRSFE